MFPLVHYFVNKEIFREVPALAALGALWPDLAFLAGCSRDQAHEMGADFWLWLLAATNGQGRDLALGIISHGVNPPGVDYYSDEHWPGYRKGWCFLRGEAYMTEVAAATRLPEELIWWKAHNFIEMACELIVNERHPEIKRLLYEATGESAALDLAAGLLSSYTGKPRGLIAGAFTRLPELFAIHDISARSLAEKQCAAFAQRHEHYNADAAAMAALLDKIRREIAGSYDSYISYLIQATGAKLKEY